MNWIRIKDSYFRISAISSIEPYFDLCTERYCIEIGVKGVGKRTFEYKAEVERDYDLAIVLKNVVGKVIGQ